MDNLTADLLLRIERLEARLRTLETTQPAASGAATAPTPSELTAAGPSSRRDLLRYGAVALGAAATAGMAPSPVEAQPPVPDKPLLIDKDNTGTSQTRLTSSSDSVGLSVEATAGYVGLTARSPGAGVAGATTSTSEFYAGVVGVSEASTGQAAGVLGIASGAQAPGVYGIGGSPGAPAVYGRHDDGGNAMRAEISSSATSNGIALYALNYSSYTGPGPGAGGFAIYGLSARGHGLVGATAAAGAAAVVGASNGVAGAYAAAFYGPTIVSGNFTVVGGAKSAAVPHADGSHRRVYCLESPESWFEDFGLGTLVCGETVVTLERDFAALVDATSYHVFLTGHDGQCDLSVSEQTAEAFRVRARGGGEGTFSWRVVAKRKDIPGPRLERVEIPKEPTLPDAPPPVHEHRPSPSDFRRMARRRTVDKRR